MLKAAQTTLLTLMPMMANIIRAYTSINRNLSEPNAHGRALYTPK